MLSIQGLFLFSFFAATVILPKHMKRIKAATMPATDIQYMSTLKKLFKATFKGPSRHSSNTLSSVELFKLRKIFFLDICAESGILNRAKIIHVAGSKGKGSTLEYIAAGLRYENRRKIGIFTSPHLHTARERIKIGTSLISKEDVIRLGEETLEKMANITWVVFFDVLLTLSMRYFGEQNVDYIILEAGIGGRFDSTNFINEPAVSVITSISLDHQSLLGDTLEEIAWQKAGIIKQNGHVFTSEAQELCVMEVLRKQCVEMNATLHIIPVSRQKVDEIGLQVSYPVQIQNACLSMAVLDFLKVPLDGLKSFFWPCRMENFVVNDVTVVLDGCHNDDSVKLFLLGLKEKYSDCKLLVLFGAGMEKYLNDMLRHVFDHADSVLMVQSKHFKSLAEIDLVEATLEGQKSKLQHYLSKDIVENSNNDKITTNDIIFSPLCRRDEGTISERLNWAIEHSRSETERSGVKQIVAVCGSLFAASEAREVLFR
mmetsp:Transcript_26416/g.25296  ORF Transcript_26416/g.25296 Transcript_26416/m.25296 type:complete len:485 (+) Transcript_26416:195-1649(+)